MQPQPECSTRIILERRLHADLRVYIDAMRALDIAQGSPQFNEIYERAERALMMVNRSRELLRKHFAEHRCGKMDDEPEK